MSLRHIPPKTGVLKVVPFSRGDVLRTTLSELFVAAGAEAAAAGFVLTQLRQGDAPLLWVQERQAEREAGRIYLPGFGARRPLLRMRLSRPAEVLAAVEEGLRCGALAGVVAELWGQPSALDFTATRRLAFRAEATGLPCWLIRHAAVPDLSAARDRWRIGMLPSATHPDDPGAPGAARWMLELFRSRSRRPGQWVVRHDGGPNLWSPDRLDLVAAVPDGPLAAHGGAKGRFATR